MSSGKKSSGGGFILIVILIAAVAVIGGRRWFSFDLSDLEPYTYEDTSSYFTGGGRAKAEDVTAIEVNWLAGEVRVVRGGGDSIVWYDDAESDAKDRDKLHWQLREDGTLKLLPAASGVRRRSAEKVLTVELPSGYIPDTLSIDGQKASVLCDGLCVRLLTVSAVGAVTAEDTVAVNARLASVSGPLTLGLTAEALTAENRSGSIGGRVCASSLTVTTGSGNITLDLDKGLAPSGTISSDSGNILLTVPDADAGFLANVTVLGHAHIQS